jgi:NADPH oxidase
MLLLPVCRNIVTFLRPTFRNILPLDESVWFHRQYAYAMLFFTFVHTTAHYVNMILVESVQARKGDDTAAGIMYTEVGGFTGHVMLVIMFFMYTSTFAGLPKDGR